MPDETESDTASRTATQPSGGAYTQGEKIAKINVADEIKNSFLDYSMSVIISRALPDVRDGLETFAAPHPLRDARAVAVSRTQALQVRENLRRHFRQLPSARRSGDLSDARPHGAAVGDARTARGRQRQFRFHRKRSAGGDALYRGAADASRRGADVRTWTRTRWISSRTTTSA